MSVLIVSFFFLGLLNNKFIRSFPDTTNSSSDCGFGEKAVSDEKSEQKRVPAKLKFSDDTVSLLGR